MYFSLLFLYIKNNGSKENYAAILFIVRYFHIFKRNATGKRGITGVKFYIYNIVDDSTKSPTTFELVKNTIHLTIQMYIHP